MRPIAKKRKPPRTQVKRPTRRPRQLSDHYWDVTHRPLQCLAFLLPMVVAYEAGMALAHGNGPLDERPRLAAQQLIYWALSLIGVPDVYFYLPGFALLAILLVWHVLKRYPWKVSWPAVAGMAAESVILALPFLVLNRLLPPEPITQTAAVVSSAGVREGILAPGILAPGILAPAAAGAIPAPAVPALQAGVGGNLPATDSLLLSIGAGLYEELVFRLIAVSALWTIFLNVVRWREVTTVALAVVLSSLLFAAHHFQYFGGQYIWSTPLFAFYAACGAYLAAVFVVRGFGLAVGCHAFYNVVVWLIVR